MKELPTLNARPMRGILMALFAGIIFSCLDSLSKYLTQHYPVMLVVWARFAFHVLLVVGVLAWRSDLALLRTVRPGIQLARGALLGLASLFFVSALSFMPLAEATAIAFLAPLFVTLMSVVLLKEKVETGRWIAVLCGFVGVLTIIRPGSGLFTWAALLPVGNALAFAVYQLLTRRLAGQESPYTSIFYAGLVGTLMYATLLPAHWVTPRNLLDTAIFAVMGMLGGLGHLILIKAYNHAPASRLAPFSYAQLIWVAVIGYVVFGDFPDTWSLVGIVIMLGSGIYIARHQHRNQSAGPAETPKAPHKR